jgi:hypothetical protein
MPDDRVDERIDDQRDHHRKPDEIGGQADDLVVEDQKEYGKTVVFDPIGHRAHAIGELDAHGHAGQFPRLLNCPFGTGVLSNRIPLPEETRKPGMVEPGTGASTSTR